jgi:hypothetical protein
MITPARLRSKYPSESPWTWRKSLLRRSARIRSPDDDGEGVEVALADPVVERDLREERRRERRQRRGEQREDGEGRLKLVRSGQAGERRDPAGGALPRPVFDLRVPLNGEMRAGLPDLHRRQPPSRSDPRTREDPTAPTRWLEPKPEMRARG